MHQAFSPFLEDSSCNGIFHVLDQSSAMSDCADIEFNYDDADSQDNEIAELYSYTEGPEFQLNLKAFEDVCGDLGVVPLWQSLTNAGRKCLVIRLSDHLELCNRVPRMRAARAILYIAQGCWGEVQSDKEQSTWVRKNIFLLVKYGIWSSFLQLLHLEIEASSSSDVPPKLAVSVSLANSADLRVILSVLYTIVETLRVSSEDDEEKHKKLRLCFKEELALPQEGEELVAMTLLGMVTRFCNSSAPHFPIRKVLLMLWKVLLFSLGGTDELKRLKTEYRMKAGLEANWEDTLEVSRTMRASSPPASAADLIEQQSNQRKRPFRRQGLMKQSSLDDSIGEIDLAPDDEERPLTDPDEPPDLPQPSSPRPSTPIPSSAKVNKGLPWTPKVRQKDIDLFLDSTRIKFVGYPLQGDRSSLAGLPQPIHEGVNVLSKHVYVSLSEIQIKKEEEITKNPLSQPEGEVPQSPSEMLYQTILPTLPQCMIALLKILLAAAPTSKSKSDSINIMADVLPEEMPMSVVQSMKLGLDVNRHKEVLVKAVSAILLLLLKHFKINHVYQFEFMSQHLVFANCIPLILKFFNQNIMAYVQAKNSIALLDFPACVIGDPPEMTAEAFEASTGGSISGAVPAAGSGGCSPTNGGEVTTSFCCWRNMFSCVNLLRILNKLCKWKHSRIMMLVVFKSAPILKRTLKVKHAMMQLYVLKLLKMQTKYLGRQWRKTNMKTLSAIYQKVRHRLNDDWAYGNDPDARPWDFQTEECALRACVDRFNSRRYNSNSNRDPDFEPVDNCITSVLGRHVELTDEFKKHYDIWLQQEVLSTTIDWDQIMYLALSYLNCRPWITVVQIPVMHIHHPFVLSSSSFP